MNTTTPSLTAQKPSTSFSIRGLSSSVKARTRSAVIAATAFAVTLPLLGVMDPEVLLASGISDAARLEAAVASMDAALSAMHVLELFATGGAAVMAFVAASLVGRAIHLKKTEQAGE